MNWEGLFRSLQGSFMAFGGTLLVLLFVYWLVRWFIKHSAPTDEDGRNARWWLNRAMVAGVVAMVGVLGWQIVSVILVNRMPRADTDRSGVYEQMQGNLNQEKR